jgi:hypothetical protein
MLLRPNKLQEKSFRRKRDHRRYSDPSSWNPPSLVDLIASNSTLNGDILADASSSANVKLEHNTFLNGAINENSLTGATGIIPNPGPPQVNPLISGPLPFTINLGIDSTSTWNMRASSTLNMLVNPQAHINFPDPPASFKTLVMNNLVGTGGIFGMHVDLGLIQGDLTRSSRRAKVSTR